MSSVIGMVETEFSVVRFRGDASAAAKVYEGLQPCTCLLLDTSQIHPLTVCVVVAEDIAEEIAWSAARPPHVNVAEVLVLPVNQATPTQAYRGGK